MSTTGPRKAYSAWITVWKSARTLVATTGSAALIALFAIEWPEDMDTMDIDGWIVFGFLLIPAAWRALENWRKNSGYLGQPRWNWPWTADVEN